MGEGDEVRNRVGPAIAAELAARGLSQQWLADQLAARGVQGSSQAMVSRWVLQKDRLTPEQVFAIEAAFDADSAMAPGTLSRHEGYVPVGANPAVTPEQAIAADPDLAYLRDVLLDAIASARLHSPRRSTTRQARRTTR